MSNSPEIQLVESGDKYFHVRFNDPERFDEIRTPDWAENVANSVSKSAEVRMGREKEGDDWEVESVLIKKQAGEDKAREQAQKIVKKIRS